MHSSDKWWFVYIIFISPSRSVCQARSTIKRKKKKKRIQAYSTRFPTISAAFKKERSRFLSWFIYISCIASFWRIALSCIMAGRTSIVVYLLAHRNTLGTMQPTESWYEVESRSILSIRSEDTRDIKKSYLAHVILVIPRKRERERGIFLRTVIFPLSISLRAFCLIIADSVFHNNRDGKRANVPCRRFVKIEIAL